MKRIGILTRDCAGINAAIRAVVRLADHHHIEVFGIHRGYEGLINGEILPLGRLAVSGILNHGGTILKTARSKRFLTREGQTKAVENLKRNNIEGLIVVGGNGSLTGAHVLSSQYGFPVIGVPATIDNDINGVDLSIGCDTAINVALDALDKIRDTATSLERLFVVEVMGRNSGYIAMQVALAGGCEEVLIPEREVNMDSVFEDISDGYKRGKISWIIIVAEGKASAYDLANRIIEKTGYETRFAVLGYIQRGGSPTALDRTLAARLGSYAAEVLRSGESDKCVHMNNNCLSTIPLETAIQTKHLKFDADYKLIKILT